MKSPISVAAALAAMATLPTAWSARSGGAKPNPFSETASGSTPMGALGDGSPAPQVYASDLDALHSYIHRTWSTLARSNRDLAKAAIDPKLRTGDEPWPVYVSRKEDLKRVRSQLAELIAPGDFAKISILKLPRTWADIDRAGLLYLPHSYLVPGGRFNEMYGWDSYFIVRGLVRDGQMKPARDMVDDAVYEVLNFGKVLNANRTYYLQRSQPPLLTRMIRAVYRGKKDQPWLASTLPAIRTLYRYWTTGPHMAGNTGLSRYHALGKGPAPEVEAGEKATDGRNQYDRMRTALRLERDSSEFQVSHYYDRRRDRLTPLAYVADRTLRESGFDPSNRFGRFSLPILDFAPVCLNSLLLVMEQDMVKILTELGGVIEAQAWSRLAERRKQRIRNLLWAPEHGLFLDYDFIAGRRRFYPFATTFFPLWAGAATAEQARQVASNALALLEAEGGLATSATVSGNQWDAPFGWAPLQLLAVEGLRAYGYDDDADRVSLKFLGTVLKEFVEHGSVFEKYDVARRESEVAPGLKFGYSSNEVGFGWTNAAFLELEAGLDPGERAEIVHAAGN